MDDDGDGDEPAVIVDVSAWPRVSFARAEERLFEADGAPASFDAAGARGEAAYAAAFRRAFAALGAAPETSSLVVVADVVRDGAARAACAAAALGALRCRRAAAAGAAWCGLLGHCTQDEPQVALVRAAGAWTAAPMEDGAVDAARAVAAADGTRAAAARAVVDAVRAFPENATRYYGRVVVVDQDGGDEARGVAAALAEIAPGCYKVKVRAAPPGAALLGAFWLDHFCRRRGAGGGYLTREAFDELVAGPDGAAGLARRFADH